MLSEVKNVRHLELGGRVAGQFRDFAAYAQSKGYDFVLYTRKSTEIGPEMTKFLASHNVTHVKLSTSRLVWEGAKDVRDMLFFK